MLGFDAEGQQYNIQHHYFTNRKLWLVVKERISETLTRVDALDYEHDFPHALASCICSKKFCGDGGKAWMEWADKHFK